MAKGTFDAIDVTELLVQWSLTKMSQSLGVDGKTIRKHIAPAVAAGIAPGGSCPVRRALVTAWDQPERVLTSCAAPGRGGEARR